MLAQNITQNFVRYLFQSNRASQTELVLLAALLYLQETPVYHSTSPHFRYQNVKLFELRGSMAYRGSIFSKSRSA